MKTLRRTMAAALAAAALALGTAACESDGGTLPDPSLAGRYTLTAVNGGALPIIFQNNASGRIDLLSGHIDIQADGDFEQVLGFRETPTGGTAGPRTSTTEGDVTVTGSTIRFSPRLGSAYSGTLNGNTITYTLTGAGGSFEFRFVKP